MVPNFLVLTGCAFIPFFFAYIWFHPKVFGGDKWTAIAGLTEAQAAKEVSPIKLGVSILLNFLLAFGIYCLTVHASGVFGLVSGNEEALKTGTAAAFLAEYGQIHTTFGHGLVHSLQVLICFVIPILGYVVIFERKSTKYFLVYGAYWLISIALMSGIISQWGWQLV